MDDTIVGIPTQAQAGNLLARLYEMIGWCRMSFKPKMRLSTVKDKAVANVFTLAQQVIPVVVGEPIKSLGRVRDSSLTGEITLQPIREN